MVACPFRALVSCTGFWQYLFRNLNQLPLLLLTGFSPIITLTGAALWPLTPLRMFVGPTVSRNNRSFIITAHDIAYIIAMTKR